MTQRPDCIRHWQALEGEDNEHYADSDERMSIVRHWGDCWD